MKVLVLLLVMLFCHIVDDYYLQGILASMKQKKWWQKNEPGKLYKHDYIMALIEHAFSWTFMVHSPLLVCSVIFCVEINLIVFLTSFLANLIVHAVIDNLKANKNRINLIQDQIAHITQIVSIWLAFIILWGGLK